MDDSKTIGEVLSEIAANPEVDFRHAHCEQHGDYESQRYTLFAGGREHWTKCPTCSDEQAAAERAREQQREAAQQAQRYQDRLDRAGIPQRFRSRTFDAFVADTEPKQRALAIARLYANEFDQRYDQGANLIFSGQPGTGKSHLGLAIAQRVMERYSAIYVTARELVMRLRATWRDDSPVSEIEMQRTFSRCGLLVIDEIGVQFGTDAERTQLFGVIDERYREELPSILLTNLDVDGFKQFVGQRAYDRLRECGMWVAFDWESYRGK